MKKLAIAGASAVLAAMPVVGVFAATSGSFTDNITVTVDGGCTLEVSGGTAGTYVDRTFSASIVNGTAETLAGVEGGAAAPAMEVTCNTAAETAWHITATAANGGALKDAQDHTIASGTATTGNASSFAYSLNGSEWLAVPTTANAAITNGSTSSNAPFSFNPTYRVYVSLGQQPGTYTGSVTYTIAMGS